MHVDLRHGFSQDTSMFSVDLHSFQKQRGHDSESEEVCRQMILSRLESVEKRALQVTAHELHACASSCVVARTRKSSQGCS